jgi:hypothetical protein
LAFSSSCPGENGRVPVRKNRRHHLARFLCAAAPTIRLARDHDRNNSGEIAERPVIPGRRSWSQFLCQACDHLFDIREPVEPRRAGDVRGQHNIIEREKLIITAARLFVLRVERKAPEVT